MEPREADNNMVLLVVVSLICVTLVGILEFGSTPVAKKPTVLAGEEPVRVILPFKPNTTPSQR
jgi:hypothetical protein